MSAAFQIFHLPRGTAISSNLTLVSGARVRFFLTTTVTPTPVYRDSGLTTPHTQPVEADSAGRLPTIYLDPSIIYRVTFTDSADVEIYPAVDPVNDQFLSQAVIGGLLYPRTQAEIAAGAVPINLAYSPDNLARFLIPNNSGSTVATANANNLIALFDPTKNGPTGRFYFPNLNGTDIYYFNNVIQIRPGVHLDLMGSTLIFSKTYATADDYMGFFTFIRDVTIQNGSIVVNYTGVGTLNPGAIMRIGSRSGYPFGSFSAGIFDKTDLADAALPLMGNILLRNLRLSTNNAVTQPVLMFGGLRNVIVENVFLDCQNGASYGIYYEFGYATTNGSPGNQTLWSSSHATNMHFRNVRVIGLNGAIAGAGISLIGAYNSTVDGLYVKSGYATFEFRPGEALFFSPWTGEDTAGAKRSITLRNINGQDITTNGMSLVGAEAPLGYLAGAGLTVYQQVDLMSFSVDGFSIKMAGATGNGISVSGPADIRNGRVTGGFNPLTIGPECTLFDIDRVELTGGAGVGVRADTNSSFVSRKKIGTISNSKICGNVGAAISLDYTESVLISRNQIGYSANYDASNEATQTNAVSVSANASGVVCEGNYCTITGAAAVYASSGTGDRGNELRSRRGATTYTAGGWLIDGVGQATSAQILDKTSAINTVNKYQYKKIWDTSNLFMVYATGPSDVSTWKIVDNSATYTPV